MVFLVNPVWAWVILLVGAYAVALLLLRRRFLGLLPYGFVAGFFYTLAIQYLAVDVLGLWRYRLAFAGPTVYGIPFFVLLVWIPEVMLFIHYYPVNNVSRVFYIFMFSVGATLIQYPFVSPLELLIYLQWNVFWTFVLAVASHLAALWIYELSGGREKLATGRA
ncbi:MAG TPA: hypothetical protein VGL40_06010 [Bacillota bacterium]